MTIRRLVTMFVFVFSVPVFAFAAQANVSLSTNSISPATININAGDTVVWSNTSSMNQSVTANDYSFQSGSIAPGGQFAATFNRTGAYNYYDNASGSAILGEVVVNGTSITTPTVQPSTQTYVNPNINYQTSVSSSNSAQAASLTAEVQQLIAEINAIEGGSSAGTGSVSGAPTYTQGGACPQIGRVLSIGTTGTDVTSLQQFLGVSPATGYYGTITQGAVQQWQTSNNIISYGTPSTTGFGVVGPRTAAAIRLACSNGSSGVNTNTNTSGTGVVSGFLQVSPVSGAAPLAVTVTATVNAANSCTGATYVLNFGDGTQSQSIPVASGNCSQQNAQFSHTYQYGGTYTITLSAGSHQSDATVTVSGPGAPGTSTGSSPTQAAGSLTALVTSGNAPLSTTFYVSCASGLAYDVVFGDGQDLGGSNVSQTSCSGGLQAVTHTYTAPGSYNAQLIIFIQNSNGTVSPQSVANQGITALGTPAPVGGSGSGSYPPPTLTPDVGSNPLAVSLQFQIGASVSYTIQWGDTQSSPGTGPSGTSNTNQTATHTYSQAGSYTVTLVRGSQTDTVGVSISN